MIDKNGKLFGKINIIDLLIILVVIAALVFVGLKVLAPKRSGGDAVQTNKVQISFYAAKVEPGVEDCLVEGAPLYEDLTNVPLGELKSWSVEPEYENQVNANGDAVKVEVPNNYFVNVTAEVNGNVTSDGLHIGSSIYCVGAHYTIHVGTAKIYAECSEITALD